MTFHAVQIDAVTKEQTNHGYTQTLLKPPTPRDATIQIRNWGPKTHIPVHKHPFNEMFYVLEGEVDIGGVNYTAGSCIYIGKGVEYGPTTSPKGCKVLRYAEPRDAK